MVQLKRKDENKEKEADNGPSLKKLSTSASFLFGDVLNVTFLGQVDEDGSGYLEFEEFCQLSAKFLVEEDEESMKKELREAFRIYDKEGKAMS